jgi:hypothetical protein
VFAKANGSFLQQGEKRLRLANSRRALPVLKALQIAQCPFKNRATNIVVRIRRSEHFDECATQSRRPVATNTTHEQQWPHARRQKSQPRSLSHPLMFSTLNTPTEGRDSTATSSATAVAAITTLVVPAGSRQTETFGSRKHAPYSGGPGSAIAA